MAKRPLTKAQKQTQYICFSFVLVFILVAVVANLIVADQFGITLQIGAPTHDSPASCSQEGSLECTTREGKCTKEQDKCVYPDNDEECLHLMFIKALSKNEKKSLKSLYTNEAILMQKTKILQQYCATEMINLYQAMTDDLSTWTLIFEGLLSVALFGLFYPQITQFAHYQAYG